MDVVRGLHAKPYSKECVWDYSLMTRVSTTGHSLHCPLSFELKYCKYILLGPCNLIVYSRHSNMACSREIQLPAYSSLQNGRSFFTVVVKFKLMHAASSSLPIGQCTCPWPTSRGQQRSSTILFFCLLK